MRSTGQALGVPGVAYKRRTCARVRTHRSARSRSRPRPATKGPADLLGGTTWIGASPAELVPELERLWRAEWRKDDG